MDLLASLHLERLPEQQTRISHLSKTLTDNPDLQLGFNACCSCASRRSTELPIECRSCRRVKYCSDKCRERDAASRPNDDDDALGHSSLICSLLRLCTADEAAEAADPPVLSDDKANDRVRSEYESYPATVANLLMDAPCYQELLMICSRRKRKDIVIHIIGASVEGELWGGNRDDIWSAYGDALGLLAEAKGFRSIQLQFVGPDCPDKLILEDRRVSVYHDDGQSSSYRLRVTSHKTIYTRQLSEDEMMRAPDVVVFFNPGFTCPDYSWKETMSCLVPAKAFIVTTNTEFEAVSECEYLWNQQLLPSLPKMVAEILDKRVSPDMGSVFISENPFRGNRVRQSGTMANDMFVKNSWVLGGVFGAPTTKSDSHEPKRSTTGPTLANKKRRKGSQNTKASNPALI